LVTKDSLTNQGSLWGGRFKSGPSPELQIISKSTQFDWRLAPADIAGSKAHADALEKAGVLTSEENKIMQAGFDKMLESFNKSELIPEETDEDLHGALERILIELVGDEIGGKIRAGRSRNDQIATSIRIYLKQEMSEIQSQILLLVSNLVEQAKWAMSGADGKPVIMPGRTHLQHAQPVLLSHHLLAHCWAILRDVDRFQDWKKRDEKSPYGSGALAGQTLGLDQNLVAKELGFTSVEPNSIDATASRDVVYEFSFICASLAINLSRLAEEIILWNTKEFSFVKLDDSYSTGSSIMPQKKNPDIPELTRGKTGRMIGDLTGLLATCKGLPLAYNRDLQEDKEPVFDQIDQLLQILPAMAGLVRTMKFNVQNLQKNAIRGFALATDIAEWLVKKDIPFRNAHEIAGELVKVCEQRAFESGKEYDLYDLSDADFDKMLPVENGHEVRSILSAEGSVSMRENINGTAPGRVQEQIIQIVKKINDFR
jgi:argininosuccinate lyase